MRKAYEKREILARNERKKENAKIKKNVKIYNKDKFEVVMKETKFPGDEKDFWSIKSRFEL